MEAKMTQEQAVLDYLKSGKTLTTLEAMKELSIVDLGRSFLSCAVKGTTLQAR